jgi:hypothetical protein
MRKRTYSTVAAAAAMALVGTVAALAGPLNGATYEGSLPVRGVAEYHHLVSRTYNHNASLVLAVSRNGRTVTAHFTSPYPFTYCSNTEALKEQKTKPASISGSGGFTAKIDQRFVAQGGEPAIVQTIVGRFSGRKATGKIITAVGGCGGTATFTAYAR